MHVQCSAPYAPATGPVTAPSRLEGRLTEWELLDNMRVGAFSHFRENNQRAFAALDGSVLCHHGADRNRPPSLDPPASLFAHCFTASLMSHF